tara:strand:- start:3001 stop:3342 length:342 start_codon:yes stop_codon:yes gene_type:complete
MKTILSALITILAGIGAYNILNSLTKNPSLILIGVIATVILCLTYTALWYKDLDNIEEDLIKNRLHEDRIPVIGARPINWEYELDIPIYDINHPIKFDRNKITYNPKTQKLKN